MLTYALRRTLISIPVILLATFITFAAISISGDPLADLRQLPNITQEQIDNVRESRGLNDPLPSQYLRWVEQVAQGGFGEYLISPRPIWPDLRRVLGNTMQLVIAAEVIAFFIAVALGVLSAKRQYSVFDYTTTTLSFIGYSMPAFLFALFLQVAVVQIFVRTGVRVFPERAELTVTCDCEDPVWPCAHGAALWSVLAEALDADPFVLLQLRGRGRERLLRELTEARRRRAHGDRVAGVDPDSLDVARWSSAQAPIEDIGVPAPEAPPTPAGALRVLGDPPGWAGGVGAWELLHPLVEGAAAWMAERDEAAGADGAAEAS